MTRELREILVGAAVVAAFGGMLLVAYSGQDVAGDAARSGYVLTAKFNRVDGLSEGDEVRMGGIRIGAVESMTLDPDYRAVVSMRLAPGAELPTDSSVAIHTDGLFGSKFLEFLPGGEEEIFRGGDTVSHTQDAQIVSELLDLIIAEGRARLVRQKLREGG